MRVVRIDPKNPDMEILRGAARVLRRGELVVYPTETAYALGCDAADPSAIRRVFEAKRRDEGKALPVIASSVAMVRKAARLDWQNAALAKAFWPGPLTLVLPNGTHRGLAVRVSPHPVASALAKLLGRPIVSTSANRSGKPTAYSAAEVLEQIGTMPDLVLDAGTLTHQAPSTIIHCDEDMCEVLREGPISAEQITDILCTA